MGRIVELLEEPPDTGIRAPAIPCKTRYPFYEFIDGSRMLAEDEFNPVLDLRCDVVVLRRLTGKGDEQRTDLQADSFQALVVGRSSAHRWLSEKRVGVWDHAALDIKMSIRRTPIRVHGYSLAYICQTKYVVSEFGDSDTAVSKLIDLISRK